MTVIPKRMFLTFIATASLCAAATSNVDSATVVNAGLYPIDIKSRQIPNPERNARGMITEYYRVWSDRPLCLGINGKDYLSINRNGSVSVANTLYAKEIRVQANPFPDYVFADDYKLMPLLEVETAIKRDRHLPGMPSAEEIHKDGMPVSQIVVKQMEKIEELTLHAINLQKQNDALQIQIQVTNARLQALEARLPAQEGR